MLQAAFDEVLFKQHRAKWMLGGGKRRRNFHQVAREAPCFKVDGRWVYQLFLQDTKKKKTKPSGFVKRWRVSFRAVSEHSHSALNGSPVTSEK